MRCRFWMSFVCCLLSVVAIVAVNTVIQYMPLIFLMEAEKAVGDVSLVDGISHQIDFIIRLQNSSNPYIDFRAVDQLIHEPIRYQKKGADETLKVELQN